MEKEKETGKGKRKKEDSIREANSGRPGLSNWIVIVEPWLQHETEWETEAAMENEKERGKGKKKIQSGKRTQGAQPDTIVSSSLNHAYNF
jgi:hypothetical protein